MVWKKALEAYGENNRPTACRYLLAMLEAAGLDGDDPESDPGSLSPARWKKLFGFGKPQVNLDWTAELLNSCAPELPAMQKTVSADPAKLFSEAITSGLPKQNYLLLLTEEVDKRKNLYKLLADQFAVIDLSVETGSSSRAQKSQHEVLEAVLRETLSKFGKKMNQDAMELLFERVGFLPVAVAMEAEKLALYTGSAEV